MHQDNRTILESLFAVGPMALSAEAEYELRAEDYVMEMPQSGERIRGRDTMKAMQEAYPAPPGIEIRRIVGGPDVFVVEATSKYPPNDDVYLVADIVEFRAGRIARETRYYASPFEPPEWRAQWVETM